MSKAFVLKGVNFSANKLATVSFTESVPCTDISLSDDSISFNSLTSETLTATLTPANTTDTLSWDSSDETVATVVNGVVTCVGIGTATITATCGEQTATCSVSVEEIIIPESDLEWLAHKQNSGTNLDATPPKDYIGAYGSESGNDVKRIMYLSPEETPSGYRALSGDGDYKIGKYPIMIPKNATTIIVEAPNSITMTSNIITYTDSTKETTYSVSPKGVKAVTNSNSNTTVRSNKCTNTIPTVEGLDSFVLTVGTSAQIDESPEGLTITFQ